MKLKPFLVFILLFCTHLIYAQNSLKIPDINVGIGEKTNIQVELNNSEPVIGVEFTLIAPKGLIVKEKETTLVQGRKGEDHAIFVNIDKNGNYHFMVFSYTNKTFHGNSGALIEIPIEIPTSYQEGQTFDINLTGAIVSSTEIQDIGSNHQGGKLIIKKGLTPDLEVSGVSISETEIEPQKTITVSWRVRNIGKKIASGGWIEQVCLVSEKTNQKYILGNVSYENDLNSGETIGRQGKFEIPEIVGIDGNCKVEINVIPDVSVKEPESDKDNNKAISVSSVLLKKLLFLNINKNQIQENSTEKIRFVITRSGDRSTSQTFTIKSSFEGQLKLPATITINEGESSAVYYAEPIDNNVTDGDRVVKVSISGNEYPEIDSEITIIDDEVPSFTLTSSKNNLNPGDKFTITLQFDEAPIQDVKITLDTDLSKRFILPEELTLKAGNTNISFEVETIDTKIPEGEVTGKITARAVGYKQASIDITLNNANIPNFEFIISPDIISEGDGLNATYAVIKKLDKTDVNLSLIIKSDIADALILPSKITFSPGQTQHKFNIGVIDNSIVEGTREVNVTASVVIPSCGCSGESSGINGTEFKQKITILDNDGLALVVKATPSTVKAGQEKASKITITRNTTKEEELSKSVLVKLSSDAPTIVEIPATVEIPAGQQSVEADINTKIDTEKKEDQTIRIQAEAEGYSSGFGWILVTDQNKPDAMITQISAIEKIEGGESLEVNTQIKNQGFASLSKGMKVEYYLSSNSLIKDLKPFAEANTNEEIAAGNTLNFKQTVLLPEQAGLYNLIVVINSDKKIEELTYTNNQAQKALELVPNYTAVIKVEKKVYKSGEIISMTGSAKKIKGGIAANKPVEIIIVNDGFIRTFTVKTNASGNFAYDFIPLQGENGHYEVSSGYPGTEVKTQDEFDLLGVVWVNKPSDYLKREATEGKKIEGEFKLKNNTQTNLTNIQVKLLTNADFTIETEALNLNAGQEGTLKYSITPNGASPVRKYYEIRADFISAEGAKTPFTSWYYCHTEKAKLTVEPVSINTTMVKGKSRLYELTVINTGSTEAKKIKIDLPKLDWIKLKSPQEIEKLGSFDTLRVVLELKPTDKQQLNVLLSGNLAINISNGQGVNVPFKVETVSEDKGSLQIDVVDEYTYNTEGAPHVQGAKVIVRHPYTGVVLAEGITDAQGVFTTENILEGWYSVTVTANKHDSYQNNFQIEPGKIKKQTVFLSYQAVSYEWTVRPTEVEDEYQIDLDVKFETNVPKPVLVTEIDDPLLNLEPGESRMSFATVTNHGLIAVNNVTISLANLQDYSFQLLIDKVDIIPAKSYITIPILIKRSMLNAKSSNSNCTTVLITKGTYLCGDSEKNAEAFKPYYTESCKGGISIDPLDPCSGPNCGGGYPGGSGFGGMAGWAGAGNIISSLPNICEGCFSDFLGAAYDCFKTFVPHTKTVKKLVKVMEEIEEIIFPEDNKDLQDLLLLHETLKCYTENKEDGAEQIKCLLVTHLEHIKFIDEIITELKEAWNCGTGVGTFLYDCLIQDYWLDFLQYVMKTKSRSTLNRTKQDIKNLKKDYEQYMKYMRIEVDRHNMLFSESFWAKENKISEFVQVKYKNIGKDNKFTQIQIDKICQEFAGSYMTDKDIVEYLTKWNLSIDAYNKGLNTENLIDFKLLEKYSKEQLEVEKYAKSRGYYGTVVPSIYEMGESINIALTEIYGTVYLKHKEQESKSSVCTTVTVRFSQKMTMTREAFEGTLEINNSSSKEIKNINLDLIITDEDGNDMTHLFQINKDAFLSGTGQVGSNSSGTGIVIFIPTKGAAPTVSKSYSFGGTLSYLDPETGEKVTAKLYPVTLEVNPSPDLVLHYFMQRDIIGDDPLTEKIEPMVPAEMSLLIKNEGYGIARNVKIQSMQPEIIENKKGLLIDFETIGSNLNNQPKQLGLLEVDFGNIAPQKAMVGQWWFTSTLLGHFVEYDIKVKHLSSYGNKDLSLIKDYQVHELIKSVKAYGEGQDDIADFLVNDIPDMNDTPDMLYYSNGDSEEVSKATSASVSNEISPSKLTTQLSFNPSFKGWNYGNVNDPGKDLYKLLKVIRNSDKLELPIENFWQTFVTLRDGKDPKYENKLHFVDKVNGNSSYSLYYIPTDTNVPKVVSFSNVPESTTTQQVEYVQVNFNKPIQKETFTYKNLRLIHQGTSIPLNASKVNIGVVNDSVFVVDIKSLTTASGYYELTVQCARIKDVKGNEGIEGKSVSWIQVIGELGIMQFTSDQNKSRSLNSIEVIFNKKVSPSEFTNHKITINGTSPDNIEITNIAGGVKYTISGLEKYNKTDGTYELSVHLPKMKAEDGSEGLVIQTFKWKVDKTLPEVDLFELQYEGAVHTQNVTDIQLTLNKPISTDFKPEWVSLYKGSVNQNATIKVTKQDDLHYLISGIGTLTQLEGGYKLIVDQKDFTDKFGNYGMGTFSKSWTVSLVKPLAVIDMKLTPDRGISSTDNITSGEDIKIILKTIEDNRKVALYVITPKGESLIQEENKEIAGLIEIPIGTFKGKNIFKAIAYDSYGNASEPVSMEAYIDEVELGVNFSVFTAKEQGCSELENVRIVFTDNIASSGVVLDVLVVKAGGVKIPAESLIVTPVSEKEFIIENIQILKNNGDISIGIDLGYLHKKLSGLQGVGIKAIELGEIEIVNSEISGPLTSSVNEIAVYTATQGMNSYKWTVTGGLITENESNKIFVNWSEKGEQSITLEYQTSTLCNKTISFKVKVDKTLSINEPELLYLETLIVSPIPNEGQFTLLMKGIEGTFSLNIYDMNGRKIYNEESVNVLFNFRKEIDLRPIQNGLYQLILYNSDKIFKVKFLIF